MCFLLQTGLFCGASLIAWILRGVLGTPWWVGGLGGCVFLFVAWVRYLVYQAKHPDWWPPWDEGLPQVMRMMNVFVPAAGVFLLMMAMLPSFIAVRQKVIKHRHRLEQQRLYQVPSDAHPITESQVR